MNIKKILQIIAQIYGAYCTGLLNLDVQIRKE